MPTKGKDGNLTSETDSKFLPSKAPSPRASRKLYSGTMKLQPVNTANKVRSLKDRLL